MIKPLKILQKHLIAPVYNFFDTYINVQMLEHECNKVSNFIYNKSRETAVILLTLNAISTISSHISQIIGLKRNKRDNGDYLITQEWEELGLDLIFTIIPPFILNKFLMKKLYLGEWTTKSTKEALQKEILPAIGASEEIDLYSSQEIVPLKETIGGMTAEMIQKIRKMKKVPKPVIKLCNLLEKNKNVRIPDPNRAVPKCALEHLTTEYDKHKGSSLGKSILNERKGLLILAAISYTVIASCIITPIIKNKLSNKHFDKKMEKEKLRLSKLPKSVIYKYNDIFETQSETEIFGIFRDKIPNEEKSNISKSPPNNLFEEFNTYNKNYSQSSGLRI